MQTNIDGPSSIRSRVAASTGRGGARLRPPTGASSRSCDWRGFGVRGGNDVAPGRSRCSFELAGSRPRASMAGSILWPGETPTSGGRWRPPSHEAVARHDEGREVPPLLQAGARGTSASSTAPSPRAPSPGRRSGTTSSRRSRTRHRRSYPCGAPTNRPRTRSPRLRWSRPGCSSVAGVLSPVLGSLLVMISGS